MNVLPGGVTNYKLLMRLHNITVSVNEPRLNSITF